jgi:hypothetical protein
MSDIAFHIITLPPPNMSASWMQFAAKHSFHLLYTLARLFARYSRNLDSSLNQTVLHRCWGHALFVCMFIATRAFFNYLAAVTITGDRAANFGQYSALRAFEQGRIFILPHLLRHGTLVYTVSSERPATTVGFEPPTQGSSDHCARRSNHCATLKILATALWDSPASNRPIALLRCASFRRGISGPFSVLR